MEDTETSTGGFPAADLGGALHLAAAKGAEVPELAEAHQAPAAAPPGPHRGAEAPRQVLLEDPQASAGGFFPAEGKRMEGGREGWGGGGGGGRGGWGGGDEGGGGGKGGRCRGRVRGGRFAGSGNLHGGETEHTGKRWTVH